MATITVTSTFVSTSFSSSIPPSFLSLSSFIKGLGKLRCMGYFLSC